MKKIIWILAVLLIGAYFVNISIVNKAKRDAERAESKRIEQATKAAVSQMASRTNAVDDWEQRISTGERFRFEPILTIELEKLWLRKQPILFIGAIKDIATHDESQYVVSVEKSLYVSFKYMFDTELQLSLSASKERIDSFLKKHPGLFNDYGFNNGIAVVARISSIRTMDVLGEDGVREEVKIGDGELIGIMYTGDVDF